MNLLIVFTVVTTVLVMVTLAPLSDIRAWWVRGWEFPRLQIALAALVTMIAAGFLLDVSEPWTWVLLAVTGAVFAFHSFWILPFLPVWRKSVPTASEADPDNRITILNANVLMTNRNAPALLRLVHEWDPDVLVALETDAWWEQQLEPLEMDYPYTCKCPLSNLYGMHVYSRLRLENAEIRFLVEEDVPSVHGDLVLRSGQRVQVHFVHPAPPSPSENYESLERDAELLLVGREVARSSGPVIISGDLNDVAWSRTTRQFRRISQLLDPRVGRGMYNTFHARYFFLRWSLDHFFHSEHFTLRRIRRLPSIGSDHFPVLFELQFQPERADEQDASEADLEDKQEAKDTIRRGLES